MERSLAEILAERMRTGAPVPVSLALAIMRQLCDALDHAHNMRDPSGQPLNIVHRDVSPQNIFISAAGAVRLVPPSTPRSTPAYMAPEYVSTGRADPRADLFSLGVIAHEMLANQPLFAADDDNATFERVFQLPVAPPSSINPTVAPEIDGLVLMALARDPMFRWPTAAMIRDGIVAIAQRLALSISSEDWHALVVGAPRAAVPQNQQWDENDNDDAATRFRAVDPKIEAEARAAAVARVEAEARAAGEAAMRAPRPPRQPTKPVPYVAPPNVEQLTQSWDQNEATVMSPPPVITATPDPDPPAPTQRPQYVDAGLPAPMKQLPRKRLDAELPAPTRAGTDADADAELPAPVQRRAETDADLHAPVKRRADAVGGVPSPLHGRTNTDADLPASVQRRADSDAEDLPAPLRRRANGDADLPAPVQRRADTDADLHPPVKRRADAVGGLPSQLHGRTNTDAELPAPVQRRADTESEDLFAPVARGANDDAELPALVQRRADTDSEDLPAPVRRGANVDADLPAPVQRRADTDAEDLPAPVVRRADTDAEDLPAPVRRRANGDAELPVPVPRRADTDAEDLPAPVKRRADTDAEDLRAPVAARNADLLTPVTRPRSEPVPKTSSPYAKNFPRPVLPFDLPSPVAKSDGGMPTPFIPGRPTAEDLGIRISQRPPSFGDVGPEPTHMGAMPLISGGGVPLQSLVGERLAPPRPKEQRRLPSAVGTFLPEPEQPKNNKLVVALIALGAVLVLVVAIVVFVL